MSFETSPLRHTVPQPDLPPRETDPFALIPVADRSDAHPFGGRTLVRSFWRLADLAAGVIDGLFGRGGSSRRWIVRETGNSFVLLRVHRGKAEMVARLDRDDEPLLSNRFRDFAEAQVVELRIDEDKIVRQRFTLPAESRSFVDQIIQHRLERLTPWQAKDVLYGYAVDTGSGRSGPIQIEFASISRRIANETVRHLARYGIIPTAIGSSSQPDIEPLAVNVPVDASKGGQTRERRITRRILLMGLPVTVGIFVISFLVEWRVRNEAALAVAALVQLQSAVQAQAAVGDSRLSDVDHLTTKTLDRASFSLLDRLAEAIPDNTFLTDIEVSPSLVRLKGSSADALALIPLLDGAAGLRDVRFESPVMREATGDDRFDIVAQRIYASSTDRPALP